MRPELEPLIQDLLRIAYGPSPVAPTSGALLVEEKDAIGLALSIAGFDREAVRRWRSTGRPARFLEGLSHLPEREDNLIWHDASRFADWKALGVVRPGALTFVSRDGRRLTIMNVNRTAVEKTLGVDLLYYRHDPAAFVLVQYKRLRKEGDRWVYRPLADRNLGREVDRMHDVLALLPPSTPKSSDDYRLNYGPFFVKLCRPVGFQAYSDDLIKGMYLPLEYLEGLFQSPSLKGKHGGVVLSYETVRRFINNTLFIELVSGCWVGSSVPSNETIEQLIRMSLEGRKSVVYALQEG
jgi:hypothetical protein